MPQALAVAFPQRSRNNELGQFFSDRFLAGVTEDALCGGIEFQDTPAGVHHDDAIQRRVEDRAIEAFHPGWRSGAGNCFVFVRVHGRALD